MHASSRETVLCRYVYDPLDRQTDCMLVSLPAILRFYCKSRLATEIQGALQTSVFQQDDQLLAQLRQQDSKVDTTLLVTDQQRSVLGARGLSESHLLAYTPYGHRPRESGLLGLLGFNGERPDPVTGHYHLGNGYRQFNPVLMRFNSPDSWSPFGEGGLNAYAYCEGDPRNREDPEGHAPIPPVIDKFLKSLATGVSNNSRTISKTSANTRTRQRQSARSSTRATGMTSNDSTVTRRPVRNDKYTAEDITSAVKQINQNEPIAEVVGGYTARFNTTDINLSSTLFNEVRTNYPFIPLPRTPNIYVPDVTVARWTNTNQLDARHFDVTISHLRNVAAAQNYLSRGSGSSFSILADVQEIRRAQYIRQNTGINLLR